MTNKKTYVYDSVEVVCTGRTAKRKLKNHKTDEKLEIEPAKSSEGTWKKWVRQAELYEIE